MAAMPAAGWADGRALTVPPVLPDRYLLPCGPGGPAGSAATAFLLVIPEKHAAFGRDYTLEPHDRVLAGTGPEVSYTQWLDFTPAKVPGLAVVQYVDCKTAAGQAAHVEAGGWWTRSGSGAHSLSN